MSIKEFAEAVRKELERTTGKEVQLREVVKNNGVVLHGISILETDINVSPTIYVEHFFEEFERDGRLEVIAEHIWEIYQRDRLPASFDITWFKSFENVRDKVAYKLVNFERNKELLKQVPHEKYLDLAKVYYVVVETEEVGRGSILVFNTHLELWGITAEQLKEAATENTPKLLPVQFGGIYDVLKLMMGEETLLDYEDCIEDCHMYVATNTSKTFGASVLCYEGVMREFAKKLETDFYILPSSIHETIIVFPKGEDDAPALREMVYMVNRTNLSPEEVLSDSVYYYSRENDAITIA